jgi:hypothetical protein
MPHADTITRHGIGLSHGVVECRDISVMELVWELETKKTGDGTTGVDDAYSLPPQGSHDVGGVVNGGFADIITLGQDIMRDKSGCKLEVTICDGALGFGKIHELGLSAQVKMDRHMIVSIDPPKRGTK